eukprot:scaffold163628_cov19-Prasinocladus_malaysianus.AAC.1
MHVHRPSAGIPQSGFRNRKQSMVCAHPTKNACKHFLKGLHSPSYTYAVTSRAWHNFPNRVSVTRMEYKGRLIRAGRV